MQVADFGFGFARRGEEAMLGVEAVGCGAASSGARLGEVWTATR